MFMKKLFVLLVMIGFSQSANAKPFKIDKAHTKINFDIAHLVISSVTGQFNEFDGTFDYDEQSGSLRDVNVTIKTASINTSHDKRDTHLKSPDFFEVEKYPDMTFTMKQTSLKIGKKSKIKGSLSFHGISKDITAFVTLLGQVVDPWGNEVLAFKLSTDVNREDFGLSWNKDIKGKITGKLIGQMAKVEIKGEANVVDLKKEEKKN